MLSYILSPTLRNWSQSPPARPRLLVSPAERNAGRLKSRDSSRVLGHSKLPSISKAKLPLQSSVAFHDDMYPAEPWNEVCMIWTRRVLDVALCLCGRVDRDALEEVL